MAGEPTRVRRNLKANTGRIIRVEQLVGRLEKRIERLEKQNAALKQQLATRAPKKPQAPAPLMPVTKAQLEKQNRSVKAEMAKLRIRVDDNAKLSKRTAAELTRLAGVREPTRALVRSFKETPGAPFSAWRMWMLATFRKQGVYRRRMFK